MKLAALTSLIAAAALTAGALALAHGLDGAQGLTPKVPETVNGPLAATAQNQHLSSGVLMHYWAHHPDRAPVELRPTLSLLSRAPGRTASPQPAVPAQNGPSANVAFNYRFNGETRGMPQNEEALAKCSTGLVGGVNDYRGFFHSDTGDGTGWEYSSDRGAHLTKEGDLPGVTVSGFYLPSGGDPAVVARNAGSGCVFYAASLSFGLDFQEPSAVVAYRTPKSTLDTQCGDNCWPTVKVVAKYKNGDTQFADKEWIATGPKPAGGSQVAVVYTLFDVNESSIRVVTCNEQLTACDTPVRLDGAAYWTNDYVQFPYVSVGPNGKVYVTWVYWKWNEAANRFDALIRGEVSNGSSWGPIRTIRTEDQPLEQGSAVLLGMAPRVATQAKSAVSPSKRWWVVWDRCGTPLTVYWECGNADVVGRYSDDDGATWSSTVGVSTGPGHQFFPSQPSFAGPSNMVVAYYTTEYARQSGGFDSRYDTAARFTTNAGAANPAFGTVRLTSVPDEPFSDWFFLSSYFIGDYLSAVADPDAGYVHYNADYTKLVPETGECLDPGACQPVNQQDNYLSKFTYP